MRVNAKAPSKQQTHKQKSTMPSTMPSNGSYKHIKAEKEGTTKTDKENAKED